MATFELYWKSTIGLYLTQKLDEMINEGVLRPELAIQVLIQFDKSIVEALETRVGGKDTVKAHLHTYRFCDSVWTFILQDALLKSDDHQEHVDCGCDLPNSEIQSSHQLWIKRELIQDCLKHQQCSV